ncbi:MAG: type II toxin-antitoxin system VapC family toxin [Alphaproteobacteria bacterium]|nr:type II toxin-antitoxin system VapC family toxin [Alphaproteobacteria bacterium]
MILVDTSVWVDHLRAGDRALGQLLDSGEVLGHCFVTGELALGNLRERDLVLSALRELPQATVASDDEVLHFIDRRALFGFGIGYVDAHLLAAVQLTPGGRLWTRDKRLQAVATQLGSAAVP